MFFVSDLAIGQEGTPNKRTRTGERVTGTNAEWRRPNKIPSLGKRFRPLGQSGNYTPLLTNRVNYLTAYIFTTQLFFLIWQKQPVWACLYAGGHSTPIFTSVGG